MLCVYVTLMLRSAVAQLRVDVLEEFRRCRCQYNLGICHCYFAVRSAQVSMDTYHVLAGKGLESTLLSPAEGGKLTVIRQRYWWFGCSSVYNFRRENNGLVKLFEERCENK
jgi:hypothetical protein